MANTLPDHAQGCALSTAAPLWPRPSSLGPPFCFPAPSWARGTSSLEIGGALGYPFRHFHRGLSTPSGLPMFCYSDT